MLTMWGTAAIGLLIGLVVGSFGGGGGVLTVPVLVYLLGQSAQDATAASVVIVGCTAVVGALARVRDGTIAWRTALAFGAAGVPAAYLGSILNQHVPEQALLLAFAGVTLVSATAMLLGGEPAEPAAGKTAPAGGRTAQLTRRRVATAVRVVGCGAAVGFLTGFLGVGGGFVVVPALVLVLRLPMTTAIGTSLVVLTINAVTALASRAGLAGLDWPVVLPFAVAAVVGTLAGKRISDHLPGHVLTRAFGVLLVLVGAFVAAESLGLL